MEQLRIVCLHTTSAAEAVAAAQQALVAGEDDVVLPFSWIHSFQQCFVKRNNTAREPATAWMVSSSNNLCFCNRVKLPKRLLVWFLKHFWGGVNVQRNTPLLQAQRWASLLPAFTEPHQQDDLQNLVHKTVPVWDRILSKQWRILWLFHFPDADLKTPHRFPRGWPNCHGSEIGEAALWSV